MEVAAVAQGEALGEPIQVMRGAAEVRWVLSVAVVYFLLIMARKLNTDVDAVGQRMLGPEVVGDVGFPVLVEMEDRLQPEVMEEVLGAAEVDIMMIIIGRRLLLLEAPEARREIQELQVPDLGTEAVVAEAGALQGGQAVREKLGEREVKLSIPMVTLLLGAEDLSHQLFLGQ